MYFICYYEYMINSQMLLDIIRYNHFSVAEVADILNLSVKDFKDKLRKGILQSNEIEMMLHFLYFPCNPMTIFFDTYDYEEPEKIEWLDVVREIDGGKTAFNYLIHRP